MPRKSRRQRKGGNGYNLFSSTRSTGAPATPQPGSRRGGVAWPSLFSPDLRNICDETRKAGFDQELCKAKGGKVIFDGTPDGGRRSRRGGAWPSLFSPDLRNICDETRKAGFDQELCRAKGGKVIFDNTLAGGRRSRRSRRSRR